MTIHDPQIHKIEQQLFDHLKNTNYSPGPLILYTSYLKNEAWKSGFISAIVLGLAAVGVLSLLKAFGLL